jgi:hypothetical protein
MLVECGSDAVRVLVNTGQYWSILVKRWMIPAKCWAPTGQTIFKLEEVLAADEEGDEDDQYLTIWPFDHLTSTMDQCI